LWRLFRHAALSPDRLPRVTLDLSYRRSGNYLSVISNSNAETLTFRLTQVLPPRGDIRSRLMTLLVLGLWVLAPSGLAADDQTPRQTGGPALSNVSVGIQGNYQVGRWTAIEADVDSDVWPVTLSVRVPDPDGNMTRQPSTEIPQPESAPVRIRHLFKSGRLMDNDDSSKLAGFTGLLQVDLETPDQTVTFHLTSEQSDSPTSIQVASLKNAWTLKTQLWATLGEAEGFEQATRRIIDRQRNLRLPVHLIDLEDDAQLPLGHDALQSLSLLAVIGRQKVSADADEAIRRWVFEGGHLILSVGTPADFEALPMSAWVPIQVTGQSRLRDLSNLTTQIPGSPPIRVSVVEALQFEFDAGQTIAATLDGPLWARVPYGFGSVTILGVDLSRRPLMNWEALPQFCEKLSGMQRTTELDSQRTAAVQLSQTGVSDLQTQLVNGLDQFPSSRKPSTWFAMGMILLYLLAIGPLDYLIVHKLLKRPHWTWVTFPLLVMLAAAGAAATARDRNPQSRLANQVDMVDVDMASNTARVQSWLSFAPPESGRFHIEARRSAALPGAATDSTSSPRISWSGVPETGFRGMYRVGGLDQWKPAYSLAPGGSGILDLPITQWSSAGTTAQWSAAPTETSQLITAELAWASGQLTGTLSNNLSTPMHEWLLAHEGRVYIPQTRTAGAAALQIAPGETLDLDNRRRVVPRVLQSFLTGVRTLHVDAGADRTGQDVIAVRDTYDPLARDPYGVLRMATFFAAAQGDAFTSLDNHALGPLDLSSLLPLDRAVLFCRVDAAAVDFLVDGEPIETTEHETVLRIVLPVNASPE
jgi:hypothetical protein